MDPIDALGRSQQEFEARLGSVGDGDWDKPTPCEEWSVHDLVNHVMLGTRMSVQLLRGATADEVVAGFEDDLVDRADALGAYTALADEMRALFGADGGLDGTVQHPMGEIPRSMFVTFRIGDQTTHAWDLARAIGADETLDPELVAECFASIQPMGQMVSESGMFGSGSSGALGDDASLQDQYLDFVGRRP